MKMFGTPHDFWVKKSKKGTSISQLMNRDFNDNESSFKKNKPKSTGEYSEMKVLPSWSEEFNDLKKTVRVKIRFFGKNAGANITTE